MQQIRLYFPLPTARQLVAGANTAYRQEINKLHLLGQKIKSEIIHLQFRKYPYKITFTYYTSDYTDMISLLTITSYILHLLETSVSLQSTDYRVVPQLDVHIETHKISLFEKEGCSIEFEPLRIKKPIK